MSSKPVNKQSINQSKPVIVMAFMSKGVLDGFSGAVGTVVGAKCNGRYIMRSKAVEVKNSNTEEQAMQRNFFKELSKASRFVSKEMLQALFPNEVKGKSRRSLLASQLAACAVIEDEKKTLDFSNIIGIGNGPEGAGRMKTTTVSDAAAVELTWDADEIMFDEDSSNAIVVLFNQTRKSVIVVNTTVLAETESATLNLKNFAQAGDQLYYYVTVATTGKVVTRGFGSFVIKTRTEN